MKRLTKYERMLLVEGIVRIVDKPPTSYWKTGGGTFVEGGSVPAWTG
jgi:hypothetical protein